MSLERITACFCCFWIAIRQFFSNLNTSGSAAARRKRNIQCLHVAIEQVYVLAVHARLQKVDLTLRKYGPCVVPNLSHFSHSLIPHIETLLASKPYIEH